MARIVGTCRLCLNETKVLVDSHIIPSSFYEEYKGKPLVAFFEETDRATTIRNGLFGKFICEECEKKFGEFDDVASQIIKKRKYTLSLVSNELKQEISVVENAYSNKDILHKFALSVLWRAKNSNRPEYKLIKLGKYEEQIRMAILNNQFSTSLLDTTGIMLWEFRGSTMAEADVTNYVYRTITKKINVNFSKTYGDFTTHIFGYPYGEILIRLGGEKPKQSNFQRVEDMIKPSVLWSTNLSENFPNLVVMKTPRIKSDSSMAGIKLLRNIFGVMAKQRSSPK